MARLALNKASQTRESKQLKTFERFLPSLDLKRRQLIAVRNEARLALAATQAEIESLQALAAKNIPMLANQKLDLQGLARVTGVELGEENLMGARLPLLLTVSVAIRPYGLLAKPHWVDLVAQYLKSTLELRIRAQVEARRLALLNDAVRVITQRVNLFDKVLIPRTKSNIKRIQIYLSDGERAAVVRAKIAKAKHARVSQ